MDSELFEKLPPTRLFFRCVITSMITMAFGALGLFLAEPFVRVLAPGATEQAIEYGVTYTRVYAAFAPLMLIFHATDTYLRVCGKEQLSMWLGAVASCKQVRS